MQHRYTVVTAWLCVIVIAVPPAAFTGWYLTVVLPLKWSYDENRAVIAAGVLTEKPMQAATEELLDEVRTNWERRTSELNGPYADSLTVIRRTPCVSDLVDVLTYRLPPFSLISPMRNLHSSTIGVIQAQLLPVCVDKRIHVSEDRNLAMIRVGTGVVFLFEDESEGMRETVWIRKDQER
jgi:hypothetical protein